MSIIYNVKRYFVELSTTTFDTVNTTVVGGGKPMSGENNWICIFEADWGCMESFADSDGTAIIL